VPGVSRKTGDPPPLRFEWERIIRSCVDLHVTVKAVALTLATYGNVDGTSIRPGNDALVADTCTSDKTVRRAVGVLRDLGLIVRVVQGSARGRAGVADEYRLAIPVDLLDRTRVRLPDGRIIGTPVTDDRCSTVDHRSRMTGDPVRNTGHLRPGTPVIWDGNTGHMGPGTPVTGDRPPEHDHISDQTMTTRRGEFVNGTHDRTGARRVNGSPRKITR
jgi:hypothetical protein